jgi:hypothetical protein
MQPVTPFLSARVLRTETAKGCVDLNAGYNLSGA